LAATLIVNPNAHAVTDERVRRVQQELGAAGELRTVRTARRGHAIELAREAEGEALFVFGGDGVFNEVLNGLERPIPVGFVPGGGTNVLPRALGIPRDPVVAARALARGRTRRIALGRVNGRRFAFSAGIGLDAEAVRRTDARRALEGRRPGDVEFAWTLARIVLERRARYAPVLELSGHGRAALLFVSNIGPYTYAGPWPLRLLPGAGFDLGLDWAAPISVGPASLAGLLLRVAAGRGLEGAPSVLSAHDTDRLEVAVDVPLPLQADGEDLGDVRDAVFEAQRDAVTVLV
jgi:diacylglycerol kinase family enzyme